MPKFSLAVARLLDLEGGYVHDPSDVGGETKYGITKMSYPQLNISTLTRADAANIYKRDWWHFYQYERINSQRISTKIFTMAVNMPARNAHKILQAAAVDVGRQRLVIDGILGPKSIKVINGCSRSRLLRAMRAKQVLYYLDRIEKKPSRIKFRNGWISRAVS